MHKYKSLSLLTIILRFCNKCKDLYKNNSVCITITRKNNNRISLRMIYTKQSQNVYSSGEPACSDSLEDLYVFFLNILWTNLGFFFSACGRVVHMEKSDGMLGRLSSEEDSDFTIFGFSVVSITSTASVFPFIDISVSVIAPIT